jgi:conjugal transfer/entry exclusion protein
MRVSASARALLAILSLSCTVRFVSRYDAATDQALTALQRHTVDFLSTMSKDDMSPSYSVAAPSYASLRNELSVLAQRNAVRDHNELTNKQLAELQAALSTLENRHKSDGQLPRAFWGPARDSLDQIFRALTKLEIQKNEGND